MLIRVCHATSGSNTVKQVVVMTRTVLGVTTASVA